jgi:hypothetical protein
MKSVKEDTTLIGVYPLSYVARNGEEMLDPYERETLTYGS